MKSFKPKIILGLPSLKVFPSYVEALREGFRMGIQSVKTQDEIAEIIKDPSKFIADLNDQTPGDFTAPTGEVFRVYPTNRIHMRR